MKRIRIRELLPLFLLLAAPVANAAEVTPAKKADDDLARVAIYKFRNTTGSKNFDYLSASLAEAIDTSLQKLFEYKRLPIGEFKKSKKPASEKAARTEAEKLSADFIIYGHYTFDKAANEIVIHVNIYLNYKKKNLPLETTRNPVDATIFNATDKVAAKIVTEIRKIAAEQDKTATVNADKDKKETVIITADTDAKADKARTQKHIEELRQYLASKNAAEYLTLSEYARLNNLKDAPDEKEKTKLMSYLKDRKINRSLNIVVRGEKVTLETIVAGHSLEKVEYNINAKKEDREKVWSKTVESLKQEETKTRLTVKETVTSATEPENSFGNRPWMVTVSAGAVKPVFKLSDYKQSAPNLNLHVRYRFFRNFSAGFYNGYFHVKRQETVLFNSLDLQLESKIEVLGSPGLSAGYQWMPGAKWLICADIIPGFYFAKLHRNVYQNSDYYEADSGGLSVRSPFLHTVASFHYMLWKGLNLGGQIMTFYFYDKGDAGLESLAAFGAGLHLSYAF